MLPPGVTGLAKRFAEFGLNDGGKVNAADPAGIALTSVLALGAKLGGTYDTVVFVGAEKASGFAVPMTIKVEYYAAVYDIASKALTLKVKNAHLKQGFYITATEDLDDDGNFYYQPDIQKIDPIIIHKVTPSGDVLYKSGFVNAGRLYSLKVVSNKLIIACGVDGTSNVGQATTKATMVIAVEE